MEPEEIQNYQQTLLNNVFAQKLEQNGKQIETWTDYKNRHKKVIEGLRVFPLSVSENCMVPIGKRALMKGRLTHTNEILVCLGDGYFAKYSASQAIALCNRRIAWADEMLKSLEAERDLYEMRQIFLEHDIFEKERKNIVEHWNESKLDEWRVQHRQHEREYNQKQAKLREKEKTDVSTDADLFKRLDELELEEELEDKRLEVKRKEFYGDDLIEGEVYNESEEYDTSDEITMEMLEEELKKVKDIKSNKVINDIENASSSDATQDNMNINTIENEQSNSPVDIIQGNLKKICSSDMTEIIPTSKSINVKKNGRISFAEYDANNESNTKDKTFQKDSFTMQDNTHGRTKDIEDDEDIVKIKFSHSSHIPNIPESNNSEIQSPVDIYKTFFMPKSILKRSPNDMAVNQTAIPINENSSTDTEDDDDDVKSFAYESIIKEDVQERKQALSVNDISIKRDEKKIISKFKKERAAVRT